MASNVVDETSRASEGLESGSDRTMCRRTRTSVLGPLTKVLYRAHHDISNDLEAMRTDLVERIVGGMPNAVVEAIVVVDQVNGRNSGSNERNVVIHHSFLGSRQVFAIAELCRRFSNYIH